MSAHIAIVTGMNLCRNPRVVKEARALVDAGYRVTVLRPILSEAMAALDAELMAHEEWEVRTTVDLTAGRGAATWGRLVRRLGAEAVRRGVDRPEALGYGVRRSLRLAREVGADLTIGHQEVGLWVANRLADEGHLVGIDLEDWYSEDLPVASRGGRPVGLLRQEEARAIRRGGHVTTTSESLAAAVAQDYEGPPPTVVYNAFPWADRESLDGLAKDRQGGGGRLSLHWVSQTIGPGRGLEDVCAALAHVEVPVDLHLRGRAAPGYEAALRGQFPADRGHALHLHGFVPPSELLSRIAEHDVGLALEAANSANNDLTVSNKILHYFLAGLPVIATATAGQCEVARKAEGAVAVYPRGETATLADLITAHAEATRLARAADRALAAAQGLFSWERQRVRLQNSVESALTSSPQ